MSPRKSKCLKKLLLASFVPFFLTACATTDHLPSPLPSSKRNHQTMRKAYYLDLMEITLSAYTTEHIDRYFDQVKKDGLTEHGFPRLTANIGILIAHNKRLDLKERFLKMMDFCCQQIPKVKAANDFSVKEIIFCIQELEKSDQVPAAKIQEWKDLLRTIDPYTCYNVYAKDMDHVVYNWAAFTMLSEFMRQKAELSDKYADFIDLQAYSQLRLLDKNKMYRDPNEPIVYDFVTRGLFAVLLHEGYKGKYQKVWQDAMEQGAEYTWKMISVTGEMPYGGRSNQFLHNEAHVAIMMEYYANHYAKKGDLKTAGQYRMLAVRALKNIAFWLNKKPISHIKNRFPIESKYGCEDYAYFDKYMITAASFLYVAYHFCDESIKPVELDDQAGTSWQTSDHFHKLFLRAGDYFAEYDYRADYHYDCSGLGRLHKKDAPSVLCLSVPCPKMHSYIVDMKDSACLAIAPGVKINGKWHYAVEKDVVHTIRKHSAEGETANAEIEYKYPSGEKLAAWYTLDRNGLGIKVSGSETLRILLPAFKFNGKDYSKITLKEGVLEVEFEGYICRYTVLDGTIIALDRPARNRNGHYETYAAEGSSGLRVQISIEKR